MSDDSHGEPSNLNRYATQFNELMTEEHEVIFDHNAINPLSELREEWQNATSMPSEYKLSTAADTNDAAFIETTARGNYSAGFQAQTGIGVRIPSKPTGDTEMRWGYYDEDDNGQPDNGFYFGADSNGIFVARADNGDIEKVYQENWNRDTLGAGELNPSDKTLDLSVGYVFQIDFTYYGYGPIEMKVLMDDDHQNGEGAADLVRTHVFYVEGQTTTENTNLPVRADIESGGTNNDALDLFVGGRQFSIIGKKTSNDRLTGHYLDSLNVDDTKWHHAISFKLKDGSGGADRAIDFRHVLGAVRRFYADTDANPYKWQIRRGTDPDNPVWENPESAEDKPDETAYKVDTNSADVQDSNGDLTGVHVDSGMLKEGGNNEANIDTEEVDGLIVDDEVITLLFKAKPATSGTISEIYFKMEERW